MLCYVCYARLHNCWQCRVYLTPPDPCRYRSLPSEFQKALPIWTLPLPLPLPSPSPSPSPSHLTLTRSGPYLNRTLPTTPPLHRPPSFTSSYIIRAPSHSYFGPQPQSCSHPAVLSSRSTLDSYNNCCTSPNTTPLASCSTAAANVLICSAPSVHAFQHHSNLGHDERYPTINAIARVSIRPPVQTVILLAAALLSFDAATRVSVGIAEFESRPGTVCMLVTTLAIANQPATSVASSF